MFNPHSNFEASRYDSLINITPDICKKYHGVFKKARHEKITAKRLSPFLWYAARKADSHGEYLVRFHVVPEIHGDDQVFISCHSVDGERCKGTLRRKRHFQNPMCVHQATIIDRASQYGRRKQKKEAA